MEYNLSFQLENRSLIQDETIELEITLSIELKCW